MATVAELLAVLRADTRQFSAAMTQARGQTASLSSSASTFSKVGVASFALVGAAAAKAVGDFMDFQTTMTRTVTLAGSSESEMRALSEEILNVSGELGKSPQELAETLYYTESAGISAANSMEVVRNAAMASAIGLGQTQEVADAVTSVLNAYGQENISAAQATDILVSAVRNGKGEADAIAGAIGRVIPIASEMGVEFKEVAGGIAALTQTGLDANEAVTALRGILTGLLNPTQQSAEALDSVGLSADSIRASIADKGLLPTLQDLKDRFNGNTAAMGQVFGNVRALAGAMSLLGANGDDVAAVFADVANSSGTTAEAFGRVSDNAEFQLAQAMADVQAELIKVGGALAPLVTGVAQLLGAAAPLIPVVLALAAAFGAWAVITKLYGAFQMLSRGVELSLGAMKMFTTTLITTRSASAAAEASMYKLGTTSTKVGASLKSAFKGAAITAGLAVITLGITKLQQAWSTSSKDIADSTGATVDQVDVLMKRADEFFGVHGLGRVAKLDFTQPTEIAEQAASAWTEAAGKLHEAGLRGDELNRIFDMTSGVVNEGTNSIREYEGTLDTWIRAADNVHSYDKALADGSMEMDAYVDHAMRMGFSQQTAMKMASDALDSYGKHVNKTGEIVRNFAGMRSKELTDWRGQVMENFTSVESVADVTAGNFADDLHKMAEAGRLMSRDMAKLKHADWVPDQFMKFLQERGPAAIHDFANAGRSEQQQMVNDWKVWDRSMGSIKGTLDKLTAAVNRLANAIRGVPDHKDIRVTTRFIQVGTPPPGYRQGDGGSYHPLPSDVHSGGFITRHRGGAVQRMHSGGMRLASDEVPAILQRGEYVLQRSAVQAIGQHALRQLNSVTNAYRARQLVIGSGVTKGEAQGVVQRIKDARDSAHFIAMAARDIREESGRDAARRFRKIAGRIDRRYLGHDGHGGDPRGDFDPHEPRRVTGELRIVGDRAYIDGVIEEKLRDGRVVDRALGRALARRGER